MAKPFGSKESDSLYIELRDVAADINDPALAKPKSLRKILANIEGGIEKCSVVRRGNKTIIEIVSPKAMIYTKGWEKPKREPVPRRKVTKRAAPG